MFDNTSDYALNKKDKDNIIYRGNDGYVHRISKEDFASEDEFLLWKSWSDEDYRVTDNADSYYQRHIIGIDGLGDGSFSTLSPEDSIIASIERKEEIEAARNKVKTIMTIITDIQFRRIWRHYVLGFKMRAIAKIEGVTHPNIVKSIVSAKKIILEKAPPEGTKTT